MRFYTTFLFFALIFCVCMGKDTSKINGINKSRFTPTISTSSDSQERRLDDYKEISAEEILEALHSKHLSAEERYKLSNFVKVLAQKMSPYPKKPFQKFLFKGCKLKVRLVRGQEGKNKLMKAADFAIEWFKKLLWRPIKGVFSYLVHGSKSKSGSQTLNKKKESALKKKSSQEKNETSSASKGTKLPSQKDGRKVEQKPSQEKDKTSLTLVLEKKGEKNFNQGGETKIAQKSYQRKVQISPAPRLKKNNNSLNHNSNYMGNDSSNNSLMNSREESKDTTPGNKEVGITITEGKTHLENKMKELGVKKVLVYVFAIDTEVTQMLEKYMDEVYTAAGMKMPLMKIPRVPGNESIYENFGDIPAGIGMYSLDSDSDNAEIKVILNSIQYWSADALKNLLQGIEKQHMGHVEGRK